MRESEKRRRKKRFNGLATRRQFGHGFLAFSSLNESLFLRTNRYTGRQSLGSVYSFLAALQQHNGRTKRRSQVRRIWLLSHRSSISSSFPSSGMVMDGLRRDAAAAISAFHGQRQRRTERKSRIQRRHGVAWMDGWTDGRTKRRNIMDNGMAGMDSGNDTPGRTAVFFSFFSACQSATAAASIIGGQDRTALSMGGGIVEDGVVGGVLLFRLSFGRVCFFFPCVCLVIR